MRLEYLIFKVFLGFFGGGGVFSKRLHTYP